MRARRGDRARRARRRGASRRLQAERAVCRARERQVRAPTARAARDGRTGAALVDWLRADAGADRRRRAATRSRSCCCPCASRPSSRARRRAPSCACECFPTTSASHRRRRRSTRPRSSWATPTGARVRRRGSTRRKHGVRGASTKALGRARDRAPARIARAMSCAPPHPLNPDAAPVALVFERTRRRRTRRPSRAPTLLPDRFVVLGYALDPATAALREVVARGRCAHSGRSGARARSAQSETWLSRDAATGRMIVPDVLQWLVDFDAAERVGMAAAHTAHRAATTRPDSIASLRSACASATPAEQGPAALEALLAKHRYGDGCAIVRAGTPTNNTDSRCSGWQPPSTDAAAAVRHRGCAARHHAAANGRARRRRRLRAWRAARPGHRFRAPPANAAATDIAEALAMNRAAGRPARSTISSANSCKYRVSPATGNGPAPVLRTWASGRGLYPALRVGRQPYGIVRDERVAKLVQVAAGPLPLREPATSHRPPRADRATPAATGMCSRDSVAHAAQAGGDPFRAAARHHRSARRARASSCRAGPYPTTYVRAALRFAAPPRPRSRRGSTSSTRRATRSLDAHRFPAGDRARPIR